MKYRTLGKTGYKVSEIGYGSWSLGGDWGTVPRERAEATLQSLPKSHINFIDTADIYGDGSCEQLIGEYLQTASLPTFVATKIGRRLQPHSAEGYTKQNIFSFVERSSFNLKQNCLDLLQLHTPPTQIYYRPEVFSFLDELVKRKKIRHYGVSVEKVEEGLKAIEYPNVSTVQIIYNMFRQRPMELFFKEAKKRDVGIIVRIPLASGLLTGKFNRFTRFERNDHRQFNRYGKYFDIGETFAGVDFATGLRAVKHLQSIKPSGMTMAQFALRWILMRQEVSTVIVGGNTPETIYENAKTSDLPKVTPQTMLEIERIYSKLIRPLVHDRW